MSTRIRQDHPGLSPPDGADARGAGGAMGPRAFRPLSACRMGWRFRGYLPHFDSPEIVQIVTFRLADSLPRSVYDEIARDLDKTRRNRRFDEILDEGQGGCTLLEPEAALLVARALHHFDDEHYRLFAWVVMPNHVHVLFEPLHEHRVGSIVKSWKSFTAKAINRRKKTSGRFWAPDYFDRFIRDEAHFTSARFYIEQNPVKAGLAPSADAWPFSSADVKL